MLKFAFTHLLLIPRPYLNLLRSTCAASPHRHWRRISIPVNPRAHPLLLSHRSLSRTVRRSCSDGREPAGVRLRLTNGSVRARQVAAQHPAAALLAAAKRKDSQASCPAVGVFRTCRPSVSLACVGVRRGNLPGSVRHAVTRALLRVPP